LIGGVALIGILGYAYLYPGTATGRAKNLISKASDANVAALNLDCAPDTDSHTPKRIVLRRLGKNLDTRVNRMEEQIIVNYTPDNGDSTNFALGKIEALRQDIDRSGREPVLTEAKHTAILKDSKEYALVEAAVSCCNRQDCKDYYDRYNKIKTFTESVLDPIPESELIH
jgi:hypothetical protein